MNNSHNVIVEVLKNEESELLDNWLQEQLKIMEHRLDLVSEKELRQQSSEFLQLLRDLIKRGEEVDEESAEWEALRDLLTEISEGRASQGFTPSESANFVFSFKSVLLRRIWNEVDDPELLANTFWVAMRLLDRVGLYVTEVFLRGREEVIQRQQEELIELSTPVVELWEGILGVPLIGTLDSSRTQIVMENLLAKIVETGSNVAIIDITGVPVVDTLVAQHLLKTVAAARLMGAECIISGIRPQIAQTIVHLGVDLSNVVTKANLSSAFAMALQRNGYTVSSLPARG